VVEPSRPQLSLAEGLIQVEVGPLWESWTHQVDTVLADQGLVKSVYEALARRRPHSRTHGRPGTPAEVVLRLLVLKLQPTGAADHYDANVVFNQSLLIVALAAAATLAVGYAGAALT
jgi:IS5 family transposase